ncbi:E2 ubiquitin-conjugating enzyme [Ascochyta rabiei]|uniref:E2 ubiquitin-conjugating enzyme n=1 Tax=Didymella rabiei TaxID=5454 RepID=UPI00220AFD11|nr:E2 ubiquitin-conjugating enzyme [Ascochyta rabiei]UPX16333.1 E2 ubiquitin-conjugating enzyme [Ascochyta rabiei]
MMASNEPSPSKALHHRLLKDVADIQQDPYPNVHFQVNDQDLYNACLILTPEEYQPLHLFVEFPHDYPLKAPVVTIQSDVVHPNIYGDYICASVLNTTEGWTPAYTLKGVLIQLLSFFSSDSLEQDHSGDTVDLAEYRQRGTVRRYTRHEGRESSSYYCDSCGFGPEWTPKRITNETSKAPTESAATISKLLSLPDEVVILMLEEIPTKDVLALADAIPLVKRTVHSYDFIRTRELQCFCLKKSYINAKLGCGISVTGGKKPILRSEFDLLSQEAFFQHNVRRSIQGVKFDKWQPLPLSRRHWNGVKTNATACLHSIHSHAGILSNEPEDIDVVYHLMNSVVVQFSADVEKGFRQPDERSTLSHASEKAVEAYFACFHLLLCLATENLAIVKAANERVNRFMTGPHTKKQFPDLGHLLVASLISDNGLTQPLGFQIIKEAILRNVVWMLDSKGADMAELAYLEPSAISEYRLVKTFEASTTSYRLLMFIRLFGSSARPAGKSLVELREGLFDSHGAPPPGVSATMAQHIRSIREISGFPGFLRAMGIEHIPSKTEFTAFLRRSITDSVKAGYSIVPMSQAELYMIRKVRERDVEVAEGVDITDAMITWYNSGEKWYWNGWKGRPTFFPNRKVS